MKSLRLFFLLLAACGGVVDDGSKRTGPSSGPASASSGGGGSSSGGGAGVGAGSGSSTSSGATTPTTTAPLYGLVVSTDATEISLRAEHLGPAFHPEDECTDQVSTFVLKRPSYVLTREKCSRPGSTGPTRKQTGVVVLTGEPRARVEQALAQLHETGRPAGCFYDGYAFSIAVTTPSETRRYLDDAYNCTQDPKNRYVAPGLGGLVRGPRAARADRAEHRRGLETADAR